MSAFAPLEPFTNVKGRSEKKKNVTNSFNNSFNNPTKMIPYFDDEMPKSKKKYKSYKVFSTLIKTVGKFVNIAITSTSIAKSITGFRLKMISI